MIQYKPQGARLAKKVTDSPLAPEELPCDVVKDASPEIMLVGEDPDLVRLGGQLIGTIQFQMTLLNCEEAATETLSSDARVWVFCSAILPFQLLLMATSVRLSSPESRLLLLLPGGLSSINDVEFLFHRVILPTDELEQLRGAISELSVDVARRKLLKVIERQGESTRTRTCEETEV